MHSHTPRHSNPLETNAVSPHYAQSRGWYETTSTSDITETCSTCSSGVRAYNQYGYPAQYEYDYNRTGYHTADSAPGYGHHDGTPAYDQAYNEQGRTWQNNVAYSNYEYDPTKLLSDREPDFSPAGTFSPFPLAGAVPPSPWQSTPTSASSYPSYAQAYAPQPTYPSPYDYNPNNVGGGADSYSESTSSSEFYYSDYGTMVEEEAIHQHQFGSPYHVPNRQRNLQPPTRQEHTTRGRNPERKHAGRGRATLNHGHSSDERELRQYSQSPPKSPSQATVQHVQATSPAQFGKFQMVHTREGIASNILRCEVVPGVSALYQAGGEVVPGAVYVQPATPATSVRTMSPAAARSPAVNKQQRGPPQNTVHAPPPPPRVPGYQHSTRIFVANATDSAAHVWLWFKQAVHMCDVSSVTIAERITNKQGEQLSREYLRGTVGRSSSGTTGSCCTVVDNSAIQHGLSLTAVVPPGSCHILAVISCVDKAPVPSGHPHPATQPHCVRCSLTELRTKEQGAVLKKNLQLVTCDSKRVSSLCTTLKRTDKISTPTPAVGSSNVHPTATSAGELRTKLMDGLTIANTCKERGYSFVDLHFPPTKSSICPRWMKNPNVTISVVWKRPRSFGWWYSQDSLGMFSPLGLGSDNIAQGHLGDCWFVCGLSLLADCQPTLLTSSVHTNAEDAVAGIVKIKMCHTGWWSTVVIDDYLPCRLGGSPAFAHSKDSRELWVSYFEKAYAKLHGSYQAIAGGSIGHALSDLTGFHCTTTVLHKVKPTLYYPNSPSITSDNNQWDQCCDEDEYVIANNPDTFWMDLTTWIGRGYLLGAGTAGADDVSNHTTAEEASALHTVGLLSGHAYSIAQVKQWNGYRLLQLHDPQGCVDWKGKWGSTSPQMTDDAKMALNGSLTDPSHVGKFWIEYRDFLQYFQAIYTCYFRQGWRDVRMRGTFNGLVPDRCMAVYVQRTTDVCISLHQQSPRGLPPDATGSRGGMNGKTQEMVELGIFVLRWHSAASTAVPQADDDATGYYALLGMVPFSKRRDITLELTLQASEHPYLIVPGATVRQKTSKPFVLSLLTKEKYFGRVEVREPDSQLISTCSAVGCLAVGTPRTYEPKLQCTLYELVYARWWCLVAVNSGTTMWNLAIHFQKSRNCTIAWTSPTSKVSGMVVKTCIAPNTIKHIAIVIGDGKNTKKSSSVLCASTPTEEEETSYTFNSRLWWENTEVNGITAQAEDWTWSCDEQVEYANLVQFVNHPLVCTPLQVDGVDYNANVMDLQKK
eukprot:TRINITY_DN63374_c0_g1_i1.p1 TRINITY_DN63374_c0_g1~~TRINITY_DN63374_c0_g1_i1.p1  ORF type:complete len:1262 (-),score=72.93 TRINITY_DN63374_c0_g1_i1:133-3918(-)